MGVVGSPPFGGVGFGGDPTIFVLKKMPVPQEVEVDPDRVLSFSARDSLCQIDKLDVYVDSVLVYTMTGAGFQNGYTGSVVPNAFFGFDLELEHADYEFASTHQVEVDVGDNQNFALAEFWSFFVRDVCYDTVRYAMPGALLSRDPLLERFLKIWDGILCFVKCRAIKPFQNGGLVDVDKLPEQTLEVAFQDAGLVFPDFDEITSEKKRRILKNAGTIHATRYSIPGLQFYLSLLIDASVQVTKIHNGNFFFWNSEVFGFPTPAMMDSSGTDADVCNYFIGQKIQTIQITITGFVSDAMKEFLKQTIYREIPMSDDPVNPMVIDLLFIP